MLPGGCIFQDRWLVLGLVLVLIAGLVVPYVVAGQMTADVVNYGPTITTPQDKLLAVYSLIEQTGQEYNRQSAIASANDTKYADKFRTYARDIFGPTIAKLLHERNELVRLIIDTEYTKEEWSVVQASMDKETDPAKRQAIWDGIFGNQTASKELPTLAWSPDLNELRAVDLGDIIGSTGYDPYEDFENDYIEYDEGDDITTSTYSISLVNAYTRGDTGYIVRDRDGDFDGDFEHLVQFDVISWGASSAPWVIFWGLSEEFTAYEDLYDNHQGSSDYMLVAYDAKSGSSRYHRLNEMVLGTIYTDTYIHSSDPEYFDTIIRDTEGGTGYGTVTMHVCEDAHFGEAGSDWQATLELDLHYDRDYRYSWGCSTWDTGDTLAYVTVDIYNLDLQLGAGPTATPWSYGYIIGG